MLSCVQVLNKYFNSCKKEIFKIYVVSHCCCVDIINCLVCCQLLAKEIAVTVEKTINISIIQMNC
jgi:hypothetical protein